MTHTVPIYKGYILPHAVLRMDVGGRNLAQWNRLCHVAQDYEAELGSVPGASATVNGNSYTLGQERIRCLEIMFQPSMLEMEGSGND